MKKSDMLFVAGAGALGLWLLLRVREKGSLQNALGGAKVSIDREQLLDVAPSFLIRNPQHREFARMGLRHLLGLKDHHET